MSEILYGCKAIKFGVAADTGVMPTPMTKLFDTYRDTVSFIEEDPDVVDEYSDQSDTPIISLHTAGAKSLKASTFDWTPATLQELKGGTVVDGMWKEPTTSAIITKAVEVELDSGHKIRCSKWQVIAKINMEIKKKNIALLEVTMKPLLPVEIGKPV